jgi:hypothetical protein
MIMMQTRQQGSIETLMLLDPDMIKIDIKFVREAFLWQPKKLSQKTDHEDDLDSQILTMQLLYHRLDINTRMKQAQHRTGKGMQEPADTVATSSTPI